MAAGRGAPDPAVEEVESRQRGSCSPVVCLLTVCLCMVLAALIVVTVLHTHTKLQAAEDENPQGGCPLVPGAAGLRGPCSPQRQPSFANLLVGDATACADWIAFACPRAGGGTRANVTYGQALLIGLARTACTDGPAGVEATMRAFFGVANVTTDLVKPTFSC